jgi:predicted nucleic acid-binding Zn ribbon protein
MMPCTVCGTPFEVRRKDHRFCSPKCRLVWFQQKPEKARRERDAKVRLLLRTAIDAATEVKELMTPDEDPS